VATLFNKSILPGSRIRVLIVDDSVVIRRLVTHAVESDPGLEVAGFASDGAIALERIPQLNPDVITLDIEMPGMDGLEVLKRVRQEYPAIRVVMFSTLTERGAAVTLQALALGADDYVTKAANAGSLDRSMTALRAELIPKIKQFFLTPVSSPQAAPGTKPKPAPVPVFKGQAPGRKVVVIGVSTGGPNALGAIVPQFPSDFPLPILIVQHMPPLFTRLLAERLQATTKLRVEEAVEGAPVAPGRVWIAPGDYHMGVISKDGKPVVALHQAPPENSCRPSVDVLFRSVGEAFGGSVISAVLTGMGQDGLRGVEVLRNQGAYVIAQDEGSSVVWGMPGAVATAGLADRVLPLASIVPDILAQVRRV
jgi:two-component system chemotaxis response regulator CheB